MDETASENANIREFGPDFVRGMPEGQTIWMVGTEYDDTTIWEECEPLGTQNLRSEDIIEELKKIPKSIRKYITSVVLSPFNSEADYAFREYFHAKSLTAIANPNPYIKQVTIYAYPLSRIMAKQLISDNRTIQHETGHIIDYLIEASIPGTTYKLFSRDDEWTAAMNEDIKMKQSEKAERGLPRFFITPYADRISWKQEDFAEAVAIYSVESNREKLKEYYPNRYKILEKLLK
jgi:hypothetical protein